MKLFNDTFFNRLSEPTQLSLMRAYCSSARVFDITPLQKFYDNIREYSEGEKEYDERMNDELFNFFSVQFNSAVSYNLKRLGVIRKGKYSAEFLKKKGITDMGYFNVFSFLVNVYRNLQRNEVDVFELIVALIYDMYDRIIKMPYINRKKLYYFDKALKNDEITIIEDGFKNVRLTKETLPKLYVKIYDSYECVLASNYTYNINEKGNIVVTYKNENLYH